MSWQRVKNAFHVEIEGKLVWIDIGVCANCGGIHIPAEEASACSKVKEFTYDEIKKKYG